MTKPETALRELAEKTFPLFGSRLDEWRKVEQDKLISDLTALISEGYYPKEFVEWLLKQDSYPQDNGGTYFLVNGVAGDDATLLFYHWNKYIKKENER